MFARRSTITLSSLTVMTILAFVGARADTGFACARKAQPVGIEELTRSLAGDAVVGASNGVLTAFDPDGRLFTAPIGSSGIVRHVAWKDGWLAYVVDRVGDDQLVSVRDGVVATLDPGGEITHPAWSPDGTLAYAVDLGRIELVATDGPTRALGAPPGTVGVFSPVFDDRGRLFVVAQEPVLGVDGHDDTLNNIYQHSSGAWTRSTAFTADVEQWSVIRTPVPEGSRLLFVREAGIATATETPRSELWELGAAGARLIRSLPQEAYLAAVSDRGIVWNVERSGDWHLVLEAPQGLFDLGCGAVMVDPRSEADPDRAPELDVPPPTEEDVPAVELGSGVGIVVGDFVSRLEAETWTASLGSAATVIDHPTAPFAVAPGMYAVAIPIPETSDGLEELDALRARFPELEDLSWISWLGGGA